MRAIAERRSGEERDPAPPPRSTTWLIAPAWVVLRKALDFHAATGPHNQHSPVCRGTLSQEQSCHAMHDVAEGALYQRGSGNRVV